MRVVNRVGQRFGRLVVIRRSGNGADGRSRWLCKCDCGQKTVVSNGNLRSARDTTSCGCYRRERAAKIAKAMKGDGSPVWKGGHGGPHCFCVRALGESRKASGARGYAACNAKVEELIPTVTDRCHLCGVQESELSKRLCLDHDHKTGKFRGWLCDRCNRVVGYIEAHHEKVMKYLGSQA